MFHLFPGDKQAEQMCFKDEGIICVIAYDTSTYELLTARMAKENEVSGCGDLEITDEHLPEELSGYAVGFYPDGERSERVPNPNIVLARVVEASQKNPKPELAQPLSWLKERKTEGFRCYCPSWEPNSCGCE